MDQECFDVVVSQKVCKLHSKMNKYIRAAACSQRNNQVGKAPPCSRSLYRWKTVRNASTEIDSGPSIICRGEEKLQKETVFSNLNHTPSSFILPQTLDHNLNHTPSSFWSVKALSSDPPTQGSAEAPSVLFHIGVCRITTEVAAGLWWGKYRGRIVKKLSLLCVVWTSTYYMN